MSNPQLSSNAASALLATINESPNTQHNSYVYSETDAIVPQTSMQWDNLVPASGSSVSSGSLHWDVNKNGYMTKMVLGFQFYCDYTGTASGAGAPALAPDWMLNCISEITISSGGRVIERHTRESLMAHISELPDYVRKAYVGGCHLDGTPTVLATPTATTKQTVFDVWLNVPGFWERNKTALNTSFIQPLRVTVRFADFANVTSATVTGTDAEDCALAMTNANSICYVQYRNLQDPVDAATIQSNYGDGLLSQLITTYSQENPQKFTSPSSGSDSFSINLKETSCVETMYIMVMRNQAKGDNTLRGCPVKLDNIQFKSNGNTYVNLPAELLQLYGTQSTHGSKGFGATNDDTSTDNTGATKYVYKVDFGQGDTDRNELTNLLSFRELAAPQVIVDYTPATANQNTDHWIFVCYKRSELSNTISSNGRFGIALSN